MHRPLPFARFAGPAAIAAAALFSLTPATADDWGTIKGRFKFGGSAPTAAEL